MNEARAIQLEALAARLDRTGTWAWLISTSRIPAMDGIRRIKVREAQHMGRVRSGAQSLVEVIDGRPDNRHKASMDVVFCSVAKHADHNALGIIMTGMGDDGACGLLAMSEPGAARSPRMKPAVWCEFPHVQGSTGARLRPMLTPPQIERLRLITCGFSRRSIASGLGHSVKTIEAPRAQIMRRLDIHDLPRLVLYALHEGLMQTNDRPVTPSAALTPVPGSPRASGRRVEDAGSKPAAVR